jgi:hypothetical protein
MPNPMPVLINICTLQREYGKLISYSHANAHCIMKILKGSLTETRFAAPTAVQINDNQPMLMVKTRETTYFENQVTYMADNLGVHRISNPHSTEYAVSLHCEPLMITREGIR